MKKSRYLLSAAVAILLLGLPFSATPQLQNRIKVLQVPGERHHFAVHLLRIINTVEAEHHIKQGSYVSWDVLRTTADFSQLFLPRGFQVGMEVYNQPGPAPEIFPGWSLRLNVSADGKGYDLILEDLTDKSCGYAAVTDERGVIRQSKTIDCEI